jgi:hypothetical protein
VTGRAVKGLSGIVLDCIGDILEEKTGGVALRAKKLPSERDPFLLLQLVQHATRLS